MSLEQTPSTKPGLPVNPFGASNGLLSNNPFSQNIKTTNDTSSAEFNGEIHLEIKSRSAKKSKTYVKGLEDTELDLDKLAMEWRKKYCCGVANVNGVVELSGDRRECVMEYLIEKSIAKQEQIKIHGF